MEPLFISINEATTVLGIGRTKTYDLIASWQLDTVKIGRRRLVSVKISEAFAKRLQGSTAERQRTYYRSQKNS
jgi:excisionase family DNA binding protein